MNKDNEQRLKTCEDIRSIISNMASRDVKKGENISQISELIHLLEVSKEMIGEENMKRDEHLVKCVELLRPLVLSPPSRIIPSNTFNTHVIFFINEYYTWLVNIEQECLRKHVTELVKEAFDKVGDILREFH